MEIVILTVIILAVMAYYGLFGSVETGARMANRTMKMLEDEQIINHDKFYAGVNMDKDIVEKATTAREYLNSRRND